MEVTEPSGSVAGKHFVHFLSIPFNISPKLAAPTETSSVPRIPSQETVNCFLDHLPEELGECWDPLEADLGPPDPGGLPPALRGEPGGRLSATDMRAAIGDCPLLPCCCCCCCCWDGPWLLDCCDSGGDPVRGPRGEPAPPLLTPRGTVG